jgi:hypothetical protein
MSAPSPYGGKFRGFLETRGNLRTSAEGRTGGPHKNPLEDKPGKETREKPDTHNLEKTWVSGYLGSE